jgi:hypothetical protein
MYKAILLALALLGASASTLAKPVAPTEYEPNLAFKREIFTGLFIKTRRCMSAGTVAMLRQEVRDRDTILDFTTRTCGQQLFVFLRDDTGQTPKQAAAFIDAMAERTLNEEINFGRK